MTDDQTINLTKLAGELGLSVATVSRALRGVPGINRETRRRVVELADTWGYAKHIQKEQTRSKAARKLRHVLVLSETSSPQTDQRYMAGMSEAAVGENIAILSHMVRHDRCESVLDPRAGPSSMRAGLVKGVVLLHRWPKEVAREIAERYPTVSVVHDYPGTPIDVLGVDERRSFLEIVAHLVAGGHRKIGFFGLCPEVSWSCSRHAAYFEALMRLDLGYEASNTVRVSLEEAVSAAVFPAGDWGRQVLERYRGAGVDAWVCPSSGTALALQRLLSEQGLVVPRDIAFTGFHRAGWQGGAPELTTTSVADEELGFAAIRRLVRRIANPEESRRTILVPATLVLGPSTRWVASPGS